MNIFQEIIRDAHNQYISDLALQLSSRIELSDFNNLSALFDASDLYYIKDEPDPNPQLSKVISFQDMTDLVSLAYYCYVVSDYSKALRLTKWAYGIKFTGNHDIWTGVQCALILNSSIYKEMDKPELAQMSMSRVTDALEQDKPINRKVFQRTLNGQFIPESYEDILKAKDKMREIGFRMTLLKELMLIREMGGSEDFPATRADNEIQENLTKLKTLMEI